MHSCLLLCPIACFCSCFSLGIYHSCCSTCFFVSCFFPCLSLCSAVFPSFESPNTFFQFKTYHTYLRFHFGRKKKDKLLKKAIFQNKSHLHLLVLLLMGMRQENANVLNFKKSLYAISSHHQHLYSVSKPMTVCLQQRPGRYFG